MTPNILRHMFLVCLVLFVVMILLNEIKRKTLLRYMPHSNISFFLLNRKKNLSTMFVPKTLKRKAEKRKFLRFNNCLMINSNMNTDQLYSVTNYTDFFHFHFAFYFFSKQKIDLLNEIIV